MSTRQHFVIAVVQLSLSALSTACTRSERHSPSGNTGLAGQGGGNGGASGGAAGERAAGGRAGEGGAGGGAVGGDAAGGSAGASADGSARESAAGGSANRADSSVGDSGTCALSTSFHWTTSNPVIVPVSDATHDLVAVKDPTIVRFGDRWHVYASSVSRAGAYNMIYTSFADWSQASSAPFYYMDQTPGFNTYVAAPELFFFAPQNKWYLVFQSGPPMYSTADNPSDPSKWTRPAPFFASEPPIITQNGGWLDFWVICDADFCRLFFSDNHGHWYQSKTSLSSFPMGFGAPVVVMQDAEAGRLFEASNVYKVNGANRYLALIEAFDSSSNWRRYFRSWTADNLDGPWVPLQDTGGAPFAGPANVTFEGGAGAWTNNLSHGEMTRAGYDQTLTIDACHLQYVFQGFDPAADGSPYNALPWKLGLLNSSPTP